ncbi:hypothetical protein NC653_033340 [Populus alba x Populus x berolinensis]|uniref:dolichyl-P-Man:Man5GlcNAc2-PP-dolichol alpha-1,3-mannosyltransferase n=1 Tax=Populus alba x Populus x berolinensis TaxID=444605 RepID=A0AAD6LUN0_9ROSI|nr:hypothetical protein NC653_033340 [Populus alba x Populus x berolinensis]
MALKSGRKLQPSRSRRPQILKNPKAAFALALIFMDALLVALIIAYVPYTKIDWDAYMSQVTGFLGGERDYTNLKGDTGPLVYPAGFLYIYSAIRFITGGEVYPAQILFGILYIINLSIVIFIYVKTEVLPWWAIILLSLSKRVHSIFVLRLFNDCFAMTLLHAALAMLLYQKWHLGLVLFSGAVSIKMNVLLYAPPLLLLMLKAMNIYGVISALACAALVQLGKLMLVVVVVIDETTMRMSVNFKFIPEPVFVSKQFAISLLIAHLGLLAAFAHYKWCRHEGGLFKFLHSKVTSALSSSSSSGLKILKEEHIMTTLFAGNFIGIVCARSLHYQFYSWYFYSLPYLLWKTHFPTVLRCGVLLECLSFKQLFICSSFLSPFTYTLGPMEGHDSEDPKQSTADMTAFVQHLLQQMQSRFQTMSDSIVSKNILTIVFTSLIWREKVSDILVCAFHYLWVHGHCLFCFLDFNALDEMGNRIDDLEKSIDELREEMGVEGSPSPLAPSKVKTGEALFVLSRQFGDWGVIVTCVEETCLQVWDDVWQLKINPLLPSNLIWFHHVYSVTCHKIAGQLSYILKVKLAINFA